MNTIEPSRDIASTIGGRDTDYNQFCVAIEQVANLLRSLELDSQVPVALIMDRGTELYASQFGVLATGGFFLPIDPGNPDQRIKFMLDDSQAMCVLVDAAAAEKVGNLGLDIHVIEVDLESVIDGSADTDHAKPVVFSHGPDDSAYMIYTSGSTGQPKGVCIHWEAICNHNLGMIDVYQITSKDRILQMVSIGFDLSVEVIFTTIRSGACLVTVDPKALDSPIRFLQWVGEQKLTLLNMPTALWHSIVPALDEAPLPDCVRLVTIGGEQIKTELVDLWFKHISPDKARLVHGYGPTETTITATVCDLTPENRESIGKPIANLECYIVGDDNQLVESVGQVGELYIAGIGVAKGYWNRPEQTEAAFMHSELLDGQWCYRTGDKVTWDEHGQLSFCGRIDSQVKFRGFRIELHEIEKAICKHPLVNNAVVQKRDGDREQLVCFAIPHDAENTARESKELQREISDFVKQSLPEYMVPARFMFLEKFPNTVGGKVDTRKLLSWVDEDQSSQSEISTSGLDEVEAEVTKVWASVLGSAPVSLDSTFEESGGDSLVGMALALGLEKSFSDKTFGTATLLSYPTVRELAGYIRSTSSNSGLDEGQEVPIINLLGQPLAAGTPVLILLHPGGGSGYFYNQLLNESVKTKYSIVIVDSPWLTRGLPENDHQHTAASIAKDYVEFLLGRLPKESPISLAGYSFGGILAVEGARFLHEHGFEVTKVINIDQPIIESLVKASLGRRLANWGLRLRSPLNALGEYADKVVRDATKAGKPTRYSKNPEMLHVFGLEDILADIEDAYQPRRCHHELHLIRGDVFLARFKLSEDYGWAEYAPKLTVHRVSGTHLSIFKGRNFTKLFAKFHELI